MEELIETVLAAMSQDPEIAVSVLEDMVSR